jgi:hypothetical protein
MPGLDLGRCTGRGCGAPVWWAITIAGRRIPINPDPDPAGTVIPVLIDGARRVQVLTGAELPAQGRAYVAHWVSCPDSEAFRRRRTADTARSACAACHGAMDAWLVEQGRRFHVNCEPLTRAEIRAVMAAAAEQDAPAARRQQELNLPEEGTP